MQNHPSKFWDFTFIYTDGNASHHHQNEWKIYFENPSPNAVNALYLIAFKNFVRNIYVNKSADWKGWNKISASSMAINKRFSIYCDELMENFQQ